MAVQSGLERTCRKSAFLDENVCSQYLHVVMMMFCSTSGASIIPKSLSDEEAAAVAVTLLGAAHGRNCNFCFEGTNNELEN